MGVFYFTMYLTRSSIFNIFITNIPWQGIAGTDFVRYFSGLSSYQDHPVKSKQLLGWFFYFYPYFGF